MRFSWSKQSGPPPVQRSVYLNLSQVQTIDMEFNDISYTVHTSLFGKETKTILKNVSGQFNSGELTAIMGPSGAGKSTLLHILTGYIKNGVEGSVKCNNRTAAKTNVFKKDACYIMQENYLEKQFTVSELMMIAANLKLGHSLSMKAKSMLIEDPLDMLGLSKCMNTKCGKLSGGQAKRFSIALELLDNPPVMFLDEPTTGLDSVSARHCVTILNALARGGRTIVCTIHQPCASILDLLDQLYILNKGQCVYQGTPHNMLPYLKEFGLVCPKYHNPADFMMEVVCGDHGCYNTELVEGAKTGKWKKPKEIILDHQSIEEMGSDREKMRTMVLIQPPKEIDRFWILLQCSFIQIYRDWTIFHLRIALHLFIGIFVGLLFINVGKDGSKILSNVSSTYAFIIYLTYTALIPAAVRFPLARDIVSKENFNNWYGIKTYFISHVLSNIPLQFIYTLIPTTLFYYLADQPMELSRYGRFVLVYFLTSLTSEGFGFFIGTLCRPVMATFCVGIYESFLIVFGGCFIFFGHMPYYVYWLAFFCYSSYSFDGVITALFSYNRPTLECPEEIVYCHLDDPRKLLKELSITGDYFWIDAGALVGIFILTRIVTYYTLKKKLCTI